MGAYGAKWGRGWLPRVLWHIHLPASNYHRKDTRAAQTASELKVSGGSSAFRHYITRIFIKSRQKCASWHEILPVKPTWGGFGSVQHRQVLEREHEFLALGAQSEPAQLSSLPVFMVVWGGPEMNAVSAAASAKGRPGQTWSNPQCSVNKRMNCMENTPSTPK